MSASERLKALDADWKGDPTDPLAAALPQIVAVVEAAERAREYASNGYSQKAAAVIRQEASLALAALEEVLQ